MSKPWSNVWWCPLCRVFFRGPVVSGCPHPKSVELDVVPKGGARLVRAALAWMQSRPDGTVLDRETSALVDAIGEVYDVRRDKR